jgi:threonine efflux protein
MTYLPSLLAIAGIHLIAVASPGPAFVATIQISVRQSRRNALLHSLGLGLAVFAWAAGALVGLQALMLHVAWLYRALQFVGGVYLVYIGVQSWLHAKDPIAAGGFVEGRG